MTERCAFCLSGSSSSGGRTRNSPACRWEEHNTLTGRTYENYDSLMRWTDGSLVHFQQSVDVTEDRRLRLQARLDDLTEMMNRRAGKEELARTLEEARQAGLPLTVCMYDVNELKEVNDTHGHVEGGPAAPADFPYRQGNARAAGLRLPSERRRVRHCVPGNPGGTRQAGKSRVSANG